jgi:transposase
MGQGVKHKSLLLCIMRKQRLHFDKAFKENAVKLSLERKNVSELAQELGIKPFLLYRWRKELEEKGDSSFSGNGIQSLSEESKRIVELEKRLNDAEIERDILKKALGIISRSGR